MVSPLVGVCVSELRRPQSKPAGGPSNRVESGPRSLWPTVVNRASCAPGYGFGTCWCVERVSLPRAGSRGGAAQPGSLTFKLQFLSTHGVQTGQIAQTAVLVLIFPRKGIREALRLDCQAIWARIWSQAYGVLGQSKKI